MRNLLPVPLVINKTLILSLCVCVCPPMGAETDGSTGKELVPSVAESDGEKKAKNYP